MAVYSTVDFAVSDTQVFLTKLLSDLTEGDGVTWFTRLQPDIDNTTSYIAVLESTPEVDLMLTTDITQKYYVVLQGTKATGGGYNTLTMSLCTREQLTVTPTAVTVAVGAPVLTIFNTTFRPNVSTEFTYRIVLSDRGFAMTFWRNSAANTVSNNFMVVVQRPVNPSNGAPKITGKAPIFYMAHPVTSSSEGFDWGIVRETDRSVSISIGNTYISDANRYLFGKISMEWPNPNLFDNSTHVVKFPFGFATSRSLYMEEIDLICLASAASFSSGQNINITMYGEADQRTYSAVWGNMQYGMIGSSVSTTIPKIIAGARIGILNVE